jgi:hypothetical protein
LENENVILIDGENEIFLDELNMEDEIMNGKFSNSTKHNKKVNRRKGRKIQTNFQKLHAQRKMWKSIT